MDESTEERVSLPERLGEKDTLLAAYLGAKGNVLSYLPPLKTKPAREGKRGTGPEGKEMEPDIDFDVESVRSGEVTALTIPTERDNAGVLFARLSEDGKTVEMLWMNDQPAKGKGERELLTETKKFNLGPDEFAVAGRAPESEHVRQVVKAFIGGKDYGRIKLGDGRATSKGQLLLGLVDGKLVIRNIGSNGAGRVNSFVAALSWEELSRVPEGSPKEVRVEVDLLSEIDVAQEQKGSVKHPDEEAKTPQILSESVVLDGRACEDRVSIIPSQKLRGNKWGISFLGGDFDGHHAYGHAGQLAEAALSVFWAALRASPEAELTEAIVRASVETDKRLKQRFSSGVGTCAEIAIAAPDGMYFAQLGDGARFWSREGKGAAMERRPNHHNPVSAGEIILSVDHSWGDAEFGNSCSSEPEVAFASWEFLKRHAYQGVLLVTDGLLDLLDLMAAGEASKKDLIKIAFERGLGAEFRKKAGEAMEEMSTWLRKEGRNFAADDVSALLVRFDWDK